MLIKVVQIIVMLPHYAYYTLEDSYFLLSSIYVELTAVAIWALLSFSRLSHNSANKLVLEGNLSE